MAEQPRTQMAVTGPGGTPGPQPPLPLPPTFPPGVDPTTYKLKEVEYLFDQSAFFNMFATSIPNQPDTPVSRPGSTAPRLLGGIGVSTPLQRFYIDVVTASKQPEARLVVSGGAQRLYIDAVTASHGMASQGIGLRANNTAGHTPAHMTFRWVLMPDDFYAAPDRVPPPTPLDMQRSQRFTMLDGTFKFDEEGQHCFHGFGTGRTFPVVIGGEPRLYLGAIGNIMKGCGVFAGAEGAYVINGYVTAPDSLYMQILLRVVNPRSELLSASELSSLEPMPEPAPDSTYMTLLGVADPDNPLQQHFAPNGQLQGATVHELMRIVHLDFDHGISGTKLRTSKTVGPIVAKLRTELSFNPFDPRTPGTALAPIPWGTRDTTITFLDGQGKTTGTLEANIVEGWGFLTQLAGAPMPVFRLLGFGPFVKSTGQLAGVEGMFSVNAFISVLPGAFSNLYVFRFVDPDRRFRLR
jgi:hypothetical protein